MDATLLSLLAMSLAAGIAMPIGAIAARFEHIQSQWLESEFRHSVIAFGGGALLSAVALILVPEGMAEVSSSTAATCLLLGGLLLMGLERWLDKHKTSAGQMLAMMSDFIPESIALGAMIAMGGEGVALLVLLMALQNLPEGFNAYRELIDHSRLSSTKIISLFALMALCGPLAAWLGYTLLSHQPVVLAVIMLIAAGGILYSVFSDIAPQAKLDNHRLPPIGAVLGFTVGVVGQMLI
ncbi:divalent cation transporter [Simiduia litorea]|uniref:ZIP family metal transporter n=1 Tax=Simiduia litorea TaxID=1435348 RepID=UPI0036F2FDC1